MKCKAKRFIRDNLKEFILSKQNMTKWEFAHRMFGFINGLYYSDQISVNAWFKYDKLITDLVCNNRIISLR